jgi:hypothetical protein
MRLRQIFGLSVLAIMAYRSYGKLRKAKSGATPGVTRFRSAVQGVRPGPRDTGTPAGGTGAAGQGRSVPGFSPAGRPVVNTPVTLTDEIR